MSPGLSSSDPDEVNHFIYLIRIYVNFIAERTLGNLQN